jgi:prepilin-type N-terminal cleavage/methylation domain-containing protein
MIRKQEGFTMVELLITMVIFVMAIAAASGIFVPLLTQFKQQSKMTETQVEGIVGLETLRRDIEQAGYGLPWNIPAGVAYQEALAAFPANYNDLPANPPRAILSGNDAMTNTVIGTSDYLVIKSTIVSTNDAAPKWTYIKGDGVGGCKVKNWGDADDFKNTDRIIALIPSRGSSETNQRILATSGGAFSDQFGNVQNFAPPLQNDKYLIYGVNANTNLRMPFNRADYYISKTLSIPQRCAAGTGLLVKSVINHGDGSRGAGMPLMDCVADMEIIYGLDVNNNGNITFSSDVTGLTAQQVRDQVKEVRVYILSHEGQKDTNYVYPSNKVTVGEFGLGNDFVLTKIADWQMYRWKLYTLVVQMKNLL